MHIDTEFTTSRPAIGNSPSPASADDFAAHLKQAADAQRGNTDKPATPPAEMAAQSQRKKTEAARAAHEAVAKELHDYLNKTPAEHLREAVLKEMGVTEEELAAMPPATRQAAEAEINRRIRERLAGKDDGAADETAAAPSVGNDPAPGAAAADNPRHGGYDSAIAIFQSINNAGRLPA